MALAKQTRYGVFKNEHADGKHSKFFQLFFVTFLVGWFDFVGNDAVSYRCNVVTKISFLGVSAT
jgi:hypothetical protein